MLEGVNGQEANESKGEVDGVEQAEGPVVSDFGARRCDKRRTWSLGLFVWLRFLEPSLGKDQGSVGLFGQLPVMGDQNKALTAFPAKLEEQVHDLAAGL